MKFKKINEDLNDISTNYKDTILKTVYKMTHTKDEDGNILPSYCIFKEVKNLFSISDKDLTNLVLNNDYNIMRIKKTNDIDGTVFIVDKDCSKDIITSDYEKFYNIDIELEELKLEESLTEDLLDESAKTDFVTKFGEKALNDFDKAKDRLKNKGL